MKIKGVHHPLQHTLGALSALWRFEKREAGQTHRAGRTGPMHAQGEGRGGGADGDSTARLE